MKRKVLMLVLAMLFIPVVVLAGGYGAVTTTSFHVPSGINIYRFELPSVATSTTDSVHSLTLTKNYGMLKAYSVATVSSTDYDFSIRTKAGAVDNTADEIVDKDTINLDYAITDLEYYFVNTDTKTTGRNDEDPYLYVVIKNDDATNATGTITIDLTILH